MDFDASTAEPVSATVAEPEFDAATAAPVEPAKKVAYALGEKAPGMTDEDVSFMREINAPIGKGGSFQQKYLEPSAREATAGAELPDAPAIPAAVDPTGGARLTAALYEGGVKPLASALTAPINLALAPIGVAESAGSFIAKTISKAAQAYFAGDLAKSGGEKAAKVVEVAHDPNATSQDFMTAVVDAAGTLGFSGLIAAHLAPEAKATEAPKSPVERAKEQTVPETAEPAFDAATAEPVANQEPFVEETAKAFDESTAEPVAKPKVQVTINRPTVDPETGRPDSLPYAQVEEQTNEGRGEPLTESERAKYPLEADILATDLPKGQYTLDRVQEAIDKSKAPEPLEDGTTATKNDQVDVEREARGLPPAMQAAAKDFPRVWDEAAKKIDENPDYAKNLVDELKDKPRAVTDLENAVLLRRQIELHNEFARVTERINDPAATPEAKAEDQVRFAKLSDDLLDLYNVDKQVGTETGRGLNARKMLANEDFSLSSMFTSRRAAKGGAELTPEEASETTALHQKIAETQKAFDDYRRRMSELLASEDTPKSRKKAQSSFVTSLGKRADAARERIKSILGQVSAGVDPALLKDYAEVGAYHIAKGVEDFAKWSKAMLDEFSDKIQPHLKAIFDAAKVRHDELEAQDPRLKAFKTRTAKQTEELKSKTERGDFAKKPSPPPIALDEEGLQLKAENERAKQAYQEALIKDRLANRNPLQKAQDTLVKWRRGFLLSGPVTLAKLTAAAAERFAFTPLEELAGSAIGKVIPSIADRAPREGGLNATAEAKAITQGLTKGIEDARDLLKTGKSNLEVLFGKGREGAVRESDVTPRSVIDFFGQIHGALKAPVKRAEFARSLEKRMAFSIKNGVDVTDPMVQTRLMVEAYKDANRSIFLQDNVVVDAWNRAITALTENKKSLGGKPSVAGKAIATTMKVLAPIVRVPTNIVAETVKTATGAVTGSLRVAYIMKKGTEGLSEEQADLVMRELKKGSLGAAALLIGYLNADKIGGYYQQGERRDKKDVTFGSMNIGGYNVPSYLLHNPLLEVVQLGATIRRVAESKVSRKDQSPQGLGTGLWAGAVGLTEEVPFVRQQIETAKMLDTREGGNARGNFVKGLVVPAAVDFAARKLDTDAQGNEIQRNPKTLLEHVESGVPGLRSSVPKKTGRK